MAIIRSTNEAAAIVAEVWANRALGKLRERLALATLANRDAEDELGALGDTIKIHKRGTLSVQSPAEGSAIVPEAPTNTSVDLVLDQYDAVSWTVSDITRSTAIEDGYAYVDDAAATLAESIESALAAEYATAGLTAVGTYGTDIDLATIRAARLAMNQGNVPRGSGRHIFMSAKDDDALIALDKLTDVDRAGTTEALREAMLGRLYGFNLFSSNLVPETGAVATVDVVGTADGVMEITINGEVATFTASSSTAQQISDGLVADINLNAAAGAVVTASNEGGTTTVITITHDNNDGSTFTLAIGGALAANLSITQAPTVETHNMAFHENGLSLAMRPLALPMPGSGAAGSYIVDPESGLAIRMLIEYSATGRGTTVILDALYGVLFHDPRLGLEIRS